MNERERAVRARLEAIEGRLRPDRFRELEAALGRSLALARRGGPEGRVERLRLDLWLGLGELDEAALLEVASVVGGLASLLVREA